MAKAKPRQARTARKGTNLIEVQEITADIFPDVLLASAFDPRCLWFIAMIRQTSEMVQRPVGERPECLMCHSEFRPDYAPKSYLFVSQAGPFDPAGAFGAGVCGACHASLKPAEFRQAITAALAPMIGDDARILPPMSEAGHA